MLGPLLFLCYLKGIDNTLTYKLNSELCIYADDSNLLISSESLEQIEGCSFVELENIGNYLRNHNLILNSQKTNYINFKTVQNKKFTDPIIVCESQIIEKQIYTNFLGLTIDQHLNWDEHVHKILIKINSGIYALSRMSYYCNLPTLKCMYFSYIHSHVSFGICLYGSTTKINMDKILKQQKRAIRIMLKLRQDK